ncbi:MAG: phosphoserine aminotransferase, partial [Deltaproteobacteria bacterium]|nr:phosphoserine aminotransferase [Deltaproteobacteria bacterium]
ARIEAYDPPWPLPKVFRIKKWGKADQSIFAGETINTPSLLCVEDYLDALAWAAEIGLNGLMARSLANLQVVADWVEKTAWIEFLAQTPAIRSSTSVCLSVVSEKVLAMTKEERAKFLKSIAGELSKNGLAHDVASYKDAPPGFRFWCGSTIEALDVKAALLALETVYNEKIQSV